MSKHAINAQRTIKAIQLCSVLVNPMDYLGCIDEEDLKAAVSDDLFDSYNLEILETTEGEFELPDKFVEEWHTYKEAAKRL